MFRKKRPPGGAIVLKGWHVFHNVVQMCMQSFTAIGRCVHDLRHFVQNGPLLQTSDVNVLGWNIKNQTDPSWSHDYIDHVYQFV